MLVGRARELAALARLGPDTPTALVGEAGVGKTSLMRAVASASGRRVFEGGGLASLSCTPYVPVARAFRTYPPRGDRAVVADWAATRTNGGLLILDDLHWADSDTLALIPLLAGRIAMLAAVRRGEPGSPRALTRLESAGVHVVRLAGLARKDAETLVRRHNATLARDTVRDIVRRARGNPLMLEELAAGGRSERSLRVLGVHRVASRADGARGLTGREREVLALVAAGLRSHEIGRQLGVSRTTVETHISSAMTKLRAKTRIQAAALAAGIDHR